MGVQKPALDLEADIAKFDSTLAEYIAGRMAEDAFRIFRLNNGIYGQRQGGRDQMVRIKAPYGSLTADQLELLGEVAERYSRGWGHLTTRQNIQFHFVQLEWWRSATAADGGTSPPGRTSSSISCSSSGCPNCCASSRLSAGPPQGDDGGGTRGGAGARAP